MAAFGLDSDINHFKKKSVPGGIEKKTSAFLGFATVPASDDLSDRNPKRRKMSEFDQQYVVNCMKKYGDDYLAMQKDIVLNCSQYTEAKMKKLCLLYKSLNDTECLVKF